jgi:hypothetical protein
VFVEKVEYKDGYSARDFSLFDVDSFEALRNASTTLNLKTRDLRFSAVVVECSNCANSSSAYLDWDNAETSNENFDTRSSDI